MQGARGSLGSEEAAGGAALDHARAMETVSRPLVSPDTCGKPLRALKQMEGGNGSG